MTELPFRQDSTFLYLTGCTIPRAALLLTASEEVLYLPPPHQDDPLWHGPEPSIEERGARLGFSVVKPSTFLAVDVKALGSLKTLAIPDENRNWTLSGWTGRPLRFGRDVGDLDLVDAVIRMRRRKSEVELQQMRLAAQTSARAHRAVMQATRPGATEQGLTAVFEGVLAASGLTTGYPTILTVRGEILHNFHHDGTLESGQLLLVDGGGEVRTGYGVDITRTTPVSGTYSPRQRAAYAAVLEAELAGIARCRAGVRYREVHDAASLVLARFLCDEGLILCSPEAAVEAHAQGVFFPHGVGHLLGLDVHDLENFGDRPSYPEGVGRPEAFGTRNLRLDLPLEEGWVVTVEPGFYVVPTILHDRSLRERFAGIINFDRAEEWIGFGGIRIEDDIAVTKGAPENLTACVPKTIAEVEAIVGSGPSVEERLG